MPTLNVPPIITNNNNLTINAINNIGLNAGTISNIHPTSTFTVNSTNIHLNATTNNIGTPLYTNITLDGPDINIGKGSVVVNENTYLDTPTFLGPSVFQPDTKIEENKISLGNISVNTTLGNWTTNTISPTTSFLYILHRICWSPELKLFVATSNANYIHYSSNGIQWQLVIITGNIRSICWSPELKIFCYVGNVATGISRNGINWVRTTNPYNLLDICWAPELGIFCGINNGNIIITSSDGIQWNTYVAPSTSYNSICWSPELKMFVAVGSNKIATSYDGMVWVSRTSPASLNWAIICWSPELGIFCSLANSGVSNRIMTSSNGINWTNHNGLSSTRNSICWNPQLKIFCAVGVENNIIASSNGINWIVLQNISQSLNGVCWSPDLGSFCCGGSNLAMISIPELKSIELNQVEVSGNNIQMNFPNIPFQTLTIGPSDNTIMDSCFIGVGTTSVSNFGTYNELVGYNSLSEIQQISVSSLHLPINTGTQCFNAMVWAPYVNALSSGVFVAFAHLSGVLRTSYDGIIWTTQSNTVSDWNSITWSPSKQLFLGVSYTSFGQNIMYSQNSVNWTRINFPIIGSWQQICVKWIEPFNMFVSGGFSRMAYSYDGINWVSTTSTLPSANWESIFYSSELGLIFTTSSSSHLIYSRNGITWTTITPPFTGWFCGDWSPDLKIFVLATNTPSTSSIAYSNNGFNWTTTTTPNKGWQSICWCSSLKMFIAGENVSSNTPLAYSTNGINWTTLYTPTVLQGNVRCSTFSPELNLFVGGNETNTGTNPKVITTNPNIPISTTVNIGAQGITSNMSITANEINIGNYSNEITLPPVIEGFKVFNVINNLVGNNTSTQSFTPINGINIFESGTCFIVISFSGYVNPHISTDFTCTLDYSTNGGTNWISIGSFINRYEQPVQAHLSYTNTLIWTPGYITVNYWRISFTNNFSNDTNDYISITITEFPI